MRKTQLNSQAADCNPNVFSTRSACSAFLMLVILAAGFTGKIHSQGNPADETKETARSLKLWGTPGEVRLVSGEPNVAVRLSLNVIAENTGKEPLLLLRRTPASTSEEIVSLANPNAPVWRQEHDAAANHDPAVAKLRRTLDVQEPPDDDIISLGPGDSIGWNIVVQLDIARGSPANWDTIRKACPCGVKLDLDLWPLVLEPSGDRADSSFGRKVSKRWRKKGTLVFTSKQTDPIEVKLPEK
jgi:hypothetical protein